jgi:peptidoglycan/LPS O-acetylase OafA/YrhL
VRRRRPRARRTWPAAAIVLYSLGLLAVLAVSLSLGGGEETAPEPWALIAVPPTLFAAGSIVVRRAERSGER